MLRMAVRTIFAALALTIPVLALGADAADRSDRTDRTARERPCGGVQPPKPTGGTYRCTFTENFDGTALDSTKWMVQETWFSGMTSANSGCYVNTSDNISVSRGAAHITARVEPEPFVCKSPYGDFTTQVTVGTIATRGRFEQAYGRWEFRARVPQYSSAGLHSAMWLYPARHTYGAWPASGEIDVAEWWSARPSYMIPSVHYAGEPAPFSSGLCTVSDPWNWHQYAVEWTATFMRFLYDGQECFRHSWTPSAPLVAPQPFDQPFYAVLTQAFGAEWNAPGPDTPRSATLDVDWVRVWR